MNDDEGRPLGDGAARESDFGNGSTVAHRCEQRPLSADISAAIEAWRWLWLWGLSGEVSWHVLFQAFGLCDCARCRWLRGGGL